MAVHLLLPSLRRKVYEAGIFSAIINNMSNNNKILLVEDDINTLKLYQEVLKNAGFAVTPAADGEEGLTKAKEGGYSLILLDVMLPKMDGLALLTELKKDPPKVKNGPIVLLTNLTHGPVIKKALNIGAKGYIIKSDVTPDELIEKIKALLK